jgi:Family of unknown function (DUF5825)
VTVHTGSVDGAELVRRCGEPAAPLPSRVVLCGRLTYPDLSALHGADLDRAGVTVLQVADEVHLAAGDAPRSLAFLRLLRETASYAIHVSWRGSVDESVDLPSVAHLDPPEDGPTTAQWRAAHRTAQCHFRVGPGFVVVRQRRGEDAPPDRVLTDPDQLTALADFLRVQPGPPASAPNRSVFTALAAQGLIGCLDGWAVTLACRRRRWPVPTAAF